MGGGGEDVRSEIEGIDKGENHLMMVISDLVINLLKVENHVIQTVVEVKVMKINSSTHSKYNQ